MNGNSLSTLAGTRGPGRRKSRISLRPVLACLMACLCAGPLLASAQTNYAIGWFTVDGGGGTSTGGVYNVTGTIGQPDAGTMSGGNYTLQSGFWGLIGVAQTPGAPRLWVSLTPTNTVVVWWALSETCWRLQVTTNLVSSGCVWAECAYQTNGATCCRIESPPAGNRFYRLRWP